MTFKEPDSRTATGSGHQIAPANEENISNKHKQISSTSQKQCSKCNVVKPLSDFYSKGTRHDSACKECQKKKKQAKYVAERKQDVVAGLTSILTLTSNGIRNRITTEIKKLDEVILCLQKSKQ